MASTQMDHQEALDMMLTYPYILPTNSKVYKGYLGVEGKDYYIEFEEQNKGIELTVSKDLEQIRWQIVNLPTHKTSLSFVKNLKGFILGKIMSPEITNRTNVYWHILMEYTKLCDFYLTINSFFISADLSNIKLSFIDDRSRLHDITIATNHQDINCVFDVVEHNLPEKEDLFCKCSAIKKIYKRFLEHINELQTFFNIMDGLDQNCWVLDPVKPTRKDLYRRIGLDTNFSMIISVNPWMSNSVPDIKLLGPERLIETHKPKIMANLVNWDTNGDFIQELLKLLELQTFFARPPEVKKKVVLLHTAGECCICFSQSLNDKLPEIVCQNSSCEKLFHKECLYQWLTSINAMQSFNKLYGNCPNCEQTISCPL